MQNIEVGTPAAPSGMSMLAIADLQDHLLIANNDLTRLATLLDDACRSLLGRFHEASNQVAALRTDDPQARERAMQQIAGAVTALQFEDMANQLISHTCARLNYCTDRLAIDAFADDDDGEAVLHDAPARPNPVTQAEMDAGSVDLF